MAVAAGLGLVVPPATLKVIAAAALLAFGVLHLTRHPHVRWGGMRVGPGDLTMWSFLMASAHGAGLMVLPIVLDAEAPAALAMHRAASAHAGHLLAAGPPAAQPIGLTATLVHAAAYLLMTGSIAVLVYEKLGLRLLRTAWINLNAIWAGALILTAMLTLVV
jgi:hypothetical protein